LGKECQYIQYSVYVGAHDVMMTVVRYVLWACVGHSVAVVDDVN
jgi:hypothetical protein